MWYVSPSPNQVRLCKHYYRCTLPVLALEEALSLARYADFHCMSLRELSFVIDVHAKWRTHCSYDARRCGEGRHPRPELEQALTSKVVKTL